MGQTLTHGVYLPDEGERNCYSGLAANWQILDTSVGTIAANTAALAGKAPAVHTHVKADITDFPAYGNAAGTICEGNDSRLSDARTPVAHTHTKSDVTDLLNSNFIPSANNSYDLGSSSYQWNNVYAKGYYCNGVAWGLDKNNEWTGQNTFKTTVTYDGSFACYWKRANLTVGTLPSSVMYYGSTRYADSAGTTITLTRGFIDTSGKNCFRTYSYAFNDISKYCIFGSGINADGSGSYFAFTAESVIPGNNNATNLGTSDNKWKTLNGTPPGALSLPNYTASIAQDISGDMVPDQYGRNIKFTSTMDGWMYVDFNISNATLLSGSQEMLVQVKDSSIANANFVVNFVTSIGSSHIFVYLPVLKGRLVILEINFTGFSIGKGYVYPCQGNV